MHADRIRTYSRSFAPRGASPSASASQMRTLVTGLQEVIGAAAGDLEVVRAHVAEAQRWMCRTGADNGLLALLLRNMLLDLVGRKTDFDPAYYTGQLERVASRIG